MRTVRPSAKAVVIRDGQVLAIRLTDGRETWHILPGGGQEAGELLPQAVEREVLEETGLRIQAEDLAFVIEGSKGESFHRVDLVFRCHLLDAAPAAPTHADTMQSGFDWLDIATLNRSTLYPSRLRRAIMALHAKLPYPTYLGNECAGDPEITD